ncbi:MAG: hypothetical protein AB8G26_11210 [Ilumatobacter sp.]
MSDWEPVDAVASVPRRSERPALRSTSAAPRFKRTRSPVLSAFDGGGRIFRSRLRDVMLGAALILVPAVALNLWLTVVADDRFVPTASTVPGSASTGREDIGVFLAAVFVSVTTAVVGFLCCTILFGDRMRQPVTLRVALGRTLRRTPAVFSAWLLTHWWFVLMAALLAVSDGDGLAALAMLFALLAWPSAAATLMVVPVMVAESLGPYAAAVRSWQLVRRRFSSCLGFVLLSTVLGAAFGTGLVTLIPSLESFGFVRLGDAVDVVAGVSVQLAVLFVVPLIAMSTAQLYLELRVAAEGLDLIADADLAFGVRNA